MQKNDCTRNCWIAAGVIGLLVWLFASGIGQTSFMGGLFLGLIATVLMGLFLVWAMCSGAGSTEDSRNDGRVRATLDEPTSLDSKPVHLAPSPDAPIAKPATASAPAAAAPAAVVASAPVTEAPKPAEPKAATAAPAASAQLASVPAPAAAAAVPAAIPAAAAVNDGPSKAADETKKPAAKAKKAAKKAAGAGEASDKKSAAKTKKSAKQDQAEKPAKKAKKVAAKAAEKPKKTPAKPDDLKQIKGVGPKLEKLLNENGVTSFAQIAKWDDAQMDSFAEKIGSMGGRIRSDDWVAQAKILATGGETEFSERVEKGDVY